MTLGEVAKDLRTGLNPRRNFRLNTPDATNYYVTVRELDGMGLCLTDKTDRVNDEGLRLINKRANLKVGDVLFSGTGTIGNTALVDRLPESWGIKEGVYAITLDQAFILPKFLIYFMHTSGSKRWYGLMAAGGTVKSISMAKMKQIEVPVPPLAEQRRIVDILDHFDALTTSLTDGLPAEIDARRRQYEYYRDKLLDFPRKASA